MAEAWLAYLNRSMVSLPKLSSVDYTQLQKLAFFTRADIQQAVLEHIQHMTNTKMWKAHAYFEHLLYDETSLEVRSYYLTDDVDKEVAKVFVVEHAWSMLVERLQWSDSTSEGPPSGSGSFVVFEGISSPSIRVSKAASGEWRLHCCSAEVLSTTTKTGHATV